MRRIDYIVCDDVLDDTPLDAEAVRKALAWWEALPADRRGGHLKVDYHQGDILGGL